MIKYSVLLMLGSVFFFNSCNRDDVENTAPSNIQLSNNVVAENAPSDTKEGNLTANDTEGDRINFSLTKGENQFKIEGTQLLTAAVIDYEEDSLISIAISASDGENSSTANFDIVVEDLNEQPLIVGSKQFADETNMPRNAGKDNGNVRPHLGWRNVPENGSFVAITMVDVNVNKWHYAVWDIPADLGNVETGGELKSNVEAESIGATEDSNDFGSGYIGPFPPSNETHSYQFTFYVYGEKLGVQIGGSKNLPNQLDGKILAQGSFSGFYSN